MAEDVATGAEGALRMRQKKWQRAEIMHAISVFRLNWCTQVYSTPTSLALKKGSCEYVMGGSDSHTIWVIELFQEKVARYPP